MIRVLLLLILAAFFSFSIEKPTLYLIGDSTVKAGKGTGENGIWGWGSVIDPFFDTTRIAIENHAIGGRSSRTFLTEGRWEPILQKIRKGDFLLIQFGHNDDWALNDTIRARGSIKGIGEDAIEIDNLLTGKHETVHSYGWYLRKYVNEARSRGAEVFICSPIPFNRYDENAKIPRKKDFYPAWAQQVAIETRAHFIDLHEMTARVYDSLGYKKVKTFYFTSKDDVHTNLEGAKLNAKHIADAIQLTDNKLSVYLK